MDLLDMERSCAARWYPSHAPAYFDELRGRLRAELQAKGLLGAGAGAGGKDVADKWSAISDFCAVCCTTHLSVFPLGCIYLYTFVCGTEE